MFAPSSFHFSEIDQELLSSGTAKRLLMACAMGGLIGIEREWRRKASGLRTNMLLCLGCAFFTFDSNQPAHCTGHQQPLGRAAREQFLVDLAKVKA